MSLARTLKAFVRGTLVEVTPVLSASVRDVLVEACSVSELKIPSIFPICKESGEGDSTWHVNRPHPSSIPPTVANWTLEGFLD